MDYDTVSRWLAVLLITATVCYMIGHILVALSGVHA